MHAVVIKVSMNDQAAAEAALGDLVPRVSAMPGFVSAYWIALSPGTGTAIHIVDSEAAAQALVDLVAAAPAGAVTTDSVEVGRVMAHA
jgi:hypothetical protein